MPMVQASRTKALFRYFVAVLGSVAINTVAGFAAAAELSVVDTHNHLFGRFGAPGRPAVIDYDGAARRALETMDRLGIRTLLILPPPFSLDPVHPYDADDLAAVVRRHPGRFAFLAGGGSLNVMIQEAVRDGGVSPASARAFDRRARAILAAGAVGFGELTAEHLSMNPRHPYIWAPPDHPLFLRLADIAAEARVPIDLHMEAVAEARRPPGRLAAPPNPARLTPNITAFERLLAHNRGASIIWSHAGWDNTGQRTVDLSRRLLAAHPNLYMSLRVAPRGGGEGRGFETTPVGSDGTVKPEWQALMTAFPKRFLIGSDEFFPSPRMRIRRHPSTGSTGRTIKLLRSLPPALADAVGHQNARRLFRLP